MRRNTSNREHHYLSKKEKAVIGENQKKRHEKTKGQRDYRTKKKTTTKRSDKETKRPTYIDTKTLRFKDSLKRLKGAKAARTKIHMIVSNKPIASFKAETW